MENRIEFIKECCDKAGWRICLDGEFYSVFVGAGIVQSKCRIQNSSMWLDIVYPLLLQRAIEGVNKSNTDWILTMFFDSIEVVLMGFSAEFFSHNGDNEDEAKESALKYICDQERNNV